MTGDPEKLKREAAGRYESADGRFTVEQSSGRWVTIDAQTTDELGLPLVRGPFATLDEARAAVSAAREAPPVASILAARIAAAAKQRRGKAKGQSASTRTITSKGPATPGKTLVLAKPREPTIALRDFEARDGEALRALWRAAGFRSTGDDDRSLAAFAARNPGLLVVATADNVVVASALGGWDGRRGWIYHVATAAAHRRTGIATRLVRRLEQRLRKAGAPKVNAIVRDENEAARAFWERLGYEIAPTHQFGREL
jgi:ribosomal protein S18 acetylase RimI-like enzyme